MQARKKIVQTKWSSAGKAKWIIHNSMESKASKLTYLFILRKKKKK